MSLTKVVRAYDTFGPLYMPLPHPSPLNQLWLKRNQWYEREALPQIRARVHGALASYQSVGK